MTAAKKCEAIFLQGKEIKNLHATSHLLDWDYSTYVPRGGVNFEHNNVKIHLCINYSILHVISLKTNILKIESV
jgi:hypothetical protein